MSGRVVVFGKCETVDSGVGNLLDEANTSGIDVDEANTTGIGFVGGFGTGTGFGSMSGLKG